MVKCPYCAEEIQDEAVLCRFCGATRAGESWQAPTDSPTARRAPGTFNLRFAGALFIVSALFEVFSVTSPVPLFGAVRGGLVASLYHLAFVGLFAWVGIGLWWAYRWGLRAILITTVVYSLERAAYLLDTTARRAAAFQSDVTRTLAILVDPGMMNQATRMAEQLTVVTALTAILCWWGFVGYAYWRRAYFAKE